MGSTNAILAKSVPVALAVLAVYGIVAWLLNQQFSHETLARIEGPVWLGVLALSLVNYGLRWVRWHGWQRRLGYPLSLPRSLLIYLTGFALVITPAKAGEVIRAWYLHKTINMPVSRTLALLYLERLLDLAAIALLAILGFGVWFDSVVMVLAASVTAGVACMILATPAVYRLARRWLQDSDRRVARILVMMLGTLEDLSGFRNLQAGLFIGIVAWFVEGVGLAMLVWSLDGMVTLQSSMAAYTGGLLAGALSMLPGGLGGAEAFTVATLNQAGVTLQVAILATLACRLATLWFAVLLGILANLFMVLQSGFVRGVQDGQRRYEHWGR